MNANEVKRLSKFLSLVLRHRPDTIHIRLSQEGWADVAELISKSRAKGVDLDEEKLHYIVENNDKKRFSFSEDLRKIRANQGHSVPVDLGLAAKKPPAVLFHGTATRNIDSIKEKGLIKGNRHHVHLSSDEEAARKVGMRYGKPIVLEISSGEMYGDGIEFYQSENGVWLTDRVPSRYITF